MATRVPMLEVEDTPMPGTQLSALILLLAAATCGPAINPQTQARVDVWKTSLSADASVYVSAEPRRRELSSGQWAQYVEYDAKGRPAQVTYKVVGREANSVWLEVERLSYHGHDVLKLLLQAPDLGRPQAWRVGRTIMQRDDKAPEELLPSSYNKLVGPLFSSLQFEVREGAARSVVVPAGTFQGAVLTEEIGSRTWIHGLVPITGYVKRLAASGVRSELVAFGDSGAETAIFGEVQGALP